MHALTLVIGNKNYSSWSLRPWLALKQANIPFSAQNVGGMFGLYFSEICPSSYAEIMANNNKAHFNQFFHSMLDSGIYLGPSAFEAGFVSAAHTDDDIAFTIDAGKKAFASLNA